MKKTDSQINQEMLMTLQLIREEMQAIRQGPTAVPELYTLAEAAEILKTDLRSVRRYAEIGILPIIKAGRMKVRRDTLLKFIRDYEGYDITDPNEIKAVFNERRAN